MPKAILALRSYPLAIFMALVLFLCSLILATSSTGIIDGGEDSGSGMGGTGKSGLPGDSGFGGTGGPSPFLGHSDNNGVEEEHLELPLNPADEPAPRLQREIETAHIPEDIAPLLELQRNPLRDPTLRPTPLFPDNPDALRIIEQDNSNLPLHMRQQLELANSGEAMTQSAPIEIRLQIPEISAPEPSEVPVLRRQLETQQAQLVEPASKQEEAASQPSENNNIAEQSAEEIVEIVTETPEITDPRSNRERILRPELPPIQRMRPAVDRASVLPARPQPMRI
jgi:hypothetical protein